jgi:hypothetical protein
MTVAPSTSPTAGFNWTSFMSGVGGAGGMGGSSGGKTTSATSAAAPQLTSTIGVSSRDVVWIAAAFAGVLFILGLLYFAFRK